MAEVIFLNNKFISKEQAKISVLTPGFLYGWGLFETMRAYHKRIVYFKAHLERIRRASGLTEMNFPYGFGKLKGIINEAVKISHETDAYVRLTLWKSEKGTNALVTVKKYQPPLPLKYKKGFHLCLSSFRQDADAFFSQFKTTSRLLYELAYLEAKKKGFDEALILNQRGYLCEASRSNIFLIKGKSLYTPALDCGCLEGVTRKVIFDLAKKDKIKVYAGKFTLQDLSKADEAFLTNSLIGVMPWASLENKLIDRGKRGKITHLFRQRYNLLLKGR